MKSSKTSKQSADEFISVLVERNAVDKVKPELVAELASVASDRSLRFLQEAEVRWAKSPLGDETRILHLARIAPDRFLSKLVESEQGSLFIQGDVLKEITKRRELEKTNILIQKKRLQEMEPFLFDETVVPIL